MDHGEHNPHLSREIRLPTMPQPQIPNHQTPLPHKRLTRRSSLPPPLKKLLPNHTTRSLTMLTLLHLLPKHMSPEPDFRTAILGRHIHEGNVNDEREWGGRVSEIGVGVDGLGFRGRCGCRWHGGVARDKGEAGFGAEDGRGYLCCEGVEEDGWGEVGGC